MRRILRKLKFFFLCEDFKIGFEVYMLNKIIILILLLLYF